MSTVEHQSPVVPGPIVIVPPLRHGDRLTREEFERRYAAMPHVKKAELIEGIVFMPSPARFDHHGEPQDDLITWIGYYRSKTPGVRSGGNATTRLAADSEPQPDELLLLPQHAGGSAMIDEDGHVSGPPDLICEVAASSKRTDLGPKKKAYCRFGVREYLVWRVNDHEIDWFELHKGKYKSMPKRDDGLLCSKVFPGLWLDVNALIAGDLPRVFAAIDRGTSTDEHAAFVRRLSTAT
jgi:Uma2 family endonuclease